MRRGEQNLGQVGFFGFFTKNREINKGKMIFSKGNGFHTREKGFWVGK